MWNLPSPEGKEIMDDEIYVIRYDGVTFSMRRFANKRVADHYLLRPNAWYLRVIKTDEDERCFHRDDWMDFITSVFNNETISNDELIYWIQYGIEIGLPQNIFESI